MVAVATKAKKSPAPKKTAGKTVVSVAPVPFKKESAPAPKKSSSVPTKIGVSSTSVKKKAVAKKVAAAPAPKKAASKKVPSVTSNERVSTPREYDIHGFVIGSDSSIICESLLAGGDDRNDLNAIITEALAGATRYGNDKNVSSLVSGLLSRLRDRGYTVESTWRLVAPAAVGAKVTPTPKTSKASTTTTKPRKKASTRKV